MQVILKDEIIQKLKEVGLKNGDTVMVHTSLGKMGYVCGGAQAVIEALMEVDVYKRQAIHGTAEGGGTTMDHFVLHRKFTEQNRAGIVFL